MCLLNAQMSTKRCLLKCHNNLYWIYKKVSIEWKCVSTKRCLLKSHNPSYLIYQNVHIEWKCIYWRKCAYWKIKSHNCLVFLNVYMALIYVIMWHNKERSTKSQTFQFYIIYKFIVNSFIIKWQFMPQSFSFVKYGFINRTRAKSFLHLILV